MARCAALGGWHKRRRRGRRKKLGEESSGREGNGAKKALEPGHWREPAGCGGARLPGVAERGDPGEGRVGVGCGGGNASSTLSAGRWGVGVGAGSARQPRWGARGPSRP